MRKPIALSKVGSGLEGSITNMSLIEIADFKKKLVVSYSTNNV